jgi:hypothetical protein
VFSCTERKEVRGLSQQQYITPHRGTVSSCTGRKEGRGLSYRHQRSGQRLPKFKVSEQYDHHRCSQEFGMGLESARLQNAKNRNAERFGSDADAQTPCDDNTEELASLKTGFASAPREADGNAESACDDKIEKLASLETRIPFERREAEAGSQTGKKEKDAAIGSLERELDDEKSAKTAKLFQKILDIRGELANKTADLEKAKLPIRRQRHQNALNTIHEKLKTALA